MVFHVTSLTLSLSIYYTRCPQRCLGHLAYFFPLVPLSFQAPPHLSKLIPSFPALMTLIVLPSSLIHLKLPLYVIGATENYVPCSWSRWETHSASTEQQAGIRVGCWGRTLPMTFTGPLPHQWDILTKSKTHSYFQNSIINVPRLSLAHQTQKHMLILFIYFFPFLTDLHVIFFWRTW